MSIDDQSKPPPPLDPALVTERKAPLTLGRIVTYIGAIFMALWILVPLFFLFSMAFTTRDTVLSYPKNVLPFVPFSTSTMRFFLGSDGVAEGLYNSLVVALLALVISTAIATPAGYAIARYVDRKSVV